MGVASEPDPICLNVTAAPCTLEASATQRLVFPVAAAHGASSVTLAARPHHPRGINCVFICRWRSRCFLSLHPMFLFGLLLFYLFSALLFIVSV